MIEVSDVLVRFPSLKRMGRIEAHRPGDTIIVEGTKGECMYIVLTGLIDVTTAGEMLDVLEPGEVLGEMALIENRPRNATAVAVTNCELLRIDAAQFSSLMQDEPGFREHMAAIVENRTSRIMAIASRLRD